MANFDTSAAVKHLDFSENGTWLATASSGETNVRIWDLRKMAQIKSLEVGFAAVSTKWDYTGQFLAVAGSQGVTIFQYVKSSKEWLELGKYAVPSLAVEWGTRARNLILLGMDGSVLELK